MSCAPRVRATGFASNPVARFTARRLLYSIIVMLGVLVVVFMLVHLVPGDPVRIALGTRYTPQAYEALRSASGLDRPIVEQFFGYIGSALTGDLGVSFRNGDPVTVTLLERLPATLSLAVAGIIIALLIAMLLPALRKAREHAVRTQCLSNQRQVGLALMQYVNQFRGAMPRQPVWMNAYATFIVRRRLGTPPDEWAGLGLLYDGQVLKDPRIFYCPAQDRLSEFTYPSGFRDSVLICESVHQVAITPEFDRMLKILEVLALFCVG